MLVLVLVLLFEGNSSVVYIMWIDSLVCPQPSGVTRKSHRFSKSFTFHPCVEGSPSCLTSLTRFLLNFTASTASVQICLSDRLLYLGTRGSRYLLKVALPIHLLQSTKETTFCYLHGEYKMLTQFSWKRYVSELLYPEDCYFRFSTPQRGTGPIRGTL